VFAGLAQRGKTSTGWFFGFKLHLIFNDRGELLNLMLTPGNVDDRKPVPKMVRKLLGKLFGDKGYISQTLRDELLRTFNVELVTGVRSNMKNTLMPLMDKLLLRKRAIIETIIDQLKNISQIEHSRHRSPINFISQPDLWTDCLLPPTQQTVPPAQRSACARCLTRIHVIYKT